jgi:hypothetical protein
VCAAAAPGLSHAASASGERLSRSETLAACEKRIAAWETFRKRASGIDWRDPAWTARSHAIMQDLYRDGESAFRACPTLSRPWTDGAYALITISFVFHQPPRVEGYTRKIEGLAREVVGNLRAQRDLYRAGKTPLPRRSDPADVPVPSAGGARAGGARASRVEEDALRLPWLASVRGVRFLSAAMLAQSVPPHCLKKPLPDVPDCGDERYEVDRWWACFIDNMNDVARYEGWEEDYRRARNQAALNLAVDAAGLPLDGLPALGHAVGTFSTDPSLGGAIGVAAATVGVAGDVAQKAAAKTAGAVVTLLQIQGHVMMGLLAGSGRAQAAGQARFARIRAGKCMSEYEKAFAAWVACTQRAEEARMQRELVELENAGIDMDPTCNPPPPSPPPPDPEDEERKRRKKEEWEKRKKEIAERMAKSDLAEPDAKKPPLPPPTDPVPPSPGHTSLPLDSGRHLESFFDVFFEITIADLKALQSPAGAATGTRVAEGGPGTSAGGKRGPNKGLLIGAGAGAVLGAVVLGKGGGDSGSTPAAVSNVPPPTATASVSPTGTGMANLTSYAFTASGTAQLYEWNFGDNTTATGASVTHVYRAAGTYTVTLTGRSGGQSATATTTLTIARDMAGRWAGPFNNRNTVITFNAAASGGRAAALRDLALSGSYADQFTSGPIAGILSGAGVCPCELRFSITLPQTSFEFVGQRVDENRIVGSYRGQGFSFATTLTRQ